MEQRTDAWHNFRAQGIGGSDVASILGISPYKTAKQLWAEKAGLVEASKAENWAMKRGTRNEPKARAQFEIITNSAWPPDLVIHPTKPHLRVSLDGQCGNEILEIKVPGAKLVSDLELRGIDAVPDHHMAQMQYQMLVTGAVLCHYVVFHPETERLVTVKIPRNETEIAMIEFEVDRFWELVQKKIDPSNEKILWAQEYKELTSAISLLEEKKEKFKNLLCSSVECGQSIEVAGLKISAFETKGAVDYSKIAILNGIDLEPYRKSSRITHRITEMS